MMRRRRQSKRRDAELDASEVYFTLTFGPAPGRPVGRGSPRERQLAKAWGLDDAGAFGCMNAYRAERRAREAA